MIRLVMFCAFLALIPLMPMWFCEAILIYPVLARRSRRAESG